MHYIKAHILDKLTNAKLLRNKDMRPPGVESNLYQYHLKQLQVEHFVQKVDSRYTLANKGLAYAATHSTTLKKERPQPQVITVLFVVDQRGRLLIRTKQRQPFIGMQGLVIGKMHRDETVYGAAAREFAERVNDGNDNTQFEYFGTAHVVVKQQGCIITDYIGLLLHVAVPDSIVLKTEGAFYDISSIKTSLLSPGVAELIGAYTQRLPFLEIEAEYGQEV